MLTIMKGVGLLLITLAVFSVFSMKAPKGSEAMSGMANAAIASFLVEAVHKYILGDVLALEFFQCLGATSGSLGGVAAAITVPLAMGVNPVFAVVSGLAVSHSFFQYIVEEHRLCHGIQESILCSFAYRFIFIPKHRHSSHQRTQFTLHSR